MEFFGSTLRCLYRRGWNESKTNRGVFSQACTIKQHSVALFVGVPQRRGCLKQLLSNMACEADILRFARECLYPKVFGPSLFLGDLSATALLISGDCSRQRLHLFLLVLYESRATYPGCACPATCEPWLIVLISRWATCSCWSAVHGGRSTTACLLIKSQSTTGAFSWLIDLSYVSVLGKTLLDKLMARGLRKVGRKLTRRLVSGVFYLLGQLGGI